MVPHSIIFKSVRIADLSGLTPEGLIAQIKKNSTTYEYFGEMIDNPFDFDVDDKLKEFIDSHTFISLDFDTEEEIDYSNTDAKKFFIDFLEKESVRMISDGKNIEVFYD